MLTLSVHVLASVTCCSIDKVKKRSKCNQISNKFSCKRCLDQVHKGNLKILKTQLGLSFS